MSIPLTITSEKQGKKKKIVEKSLINSGAGGNFIDQNFAKAQGFELTPLAKPIQVFNVDGTLKKKGTIKHYVDLKLTIHGRKKTTRILVTGLGKQKIILGFPWLQKHNPDIDWKEGTFKWRKAKNTPKPSMKGIKDQDAHLNSTQHPLSDEEKELLIRFTERMEEEDGNIEINAKVTASQQLHFTHDEKKKEISLEERIPKEYHKFLDVFDEKKADQFPEERVWDHKIEMKDGFIPKSFKNYNSHQRNKSNWTNS